MRTMVKMILVGFGGFLGAVARWVVAGAVQRVAGSEFPAGTLVVNVAGCFAIGVMMALVTEYQLLGPGTRVFVITGFLGAFTTFSTFGYETLEMARSGAWPGALLNVAVSLAVGLGAVFGGLLTVRAIWR
jgi:CrcB protein